MLLKEYCKLQIKIISRKISDFGLPPILVLLVLPIIFVPLSEYFFSKVKFAHFLYASIPLGLLLKQSGKERNDFLKSIFKTSDYYKVRMIENLIPTVAFIAFLSYKQFFLIAGGVFFIAICFALFNFNSNVNYTIPTPFEKKPFEFIIGFRKTFFLFPLIYLLAFVATSVDNFNLGIASIVFSMLICMSYYSKLETDYFVWNYQLTAKQFLHHKIKIAFKNSLILNLPTVLIVGICFYKQADITILFFLLSHIYLVIILLAKYSNFPKEMNLPQGILIAFCFAFPPFLLVILPYFYSKSIKRLNNLLV